MKKTISVISTVLVLLFMMSCVAGCNAGNGVPVGTYKLTELSEGGQDYTEYLSLLGDATLTINEDKTAVMSVYGETTNLTVDPEAGTLTDESGTAATYTLEGNKLVIVQDDTRMVFEKQ